MSFTLSRNEVVALLGVCRTRTFALQQIGQLRVLASTGGKGRFDLREVLVCAADLHGQSLPTVADVQMHMTALVAARLNLPSRRTSLSTRS